MCCFLCSVIILKISFLSLHPDLRAIVVMSAALLSMTHLQVTGCIMSYHLHYL